eukprot:TRINITY_DN3968_c0_g2_i1.p1 TRINITY_DN3968_c0_g2~~TRINITY_DN3968_c0_g2_i1.p1  ORF type:complete len:2044 (-),score=893.51 TRINITY_DN3968_c0_g2_i1:341-6472(-)
MMKGGKGTQWKPQAGKGAAKPGGPVIKKAPVTTPSQPGKGGPQVAKRVASPGPATGPLAKKPNVGGGQDKTKLRVYSQTSKDDEVATTLVGTYTEVGENHGRPTYKKNEKIPGHPNISVFVYYWDQRDGADFSGWWFGDEVGGSQVWALAKISTPKPPKMGWRVPWDAKAVKPGALLLEEITGSVAGIPAQKAAAAPAGKGATGKGGAAQTGGAVTIAHVAQMVKKVTEEVKALETTTTNMLTSATKTLANPKTTEKVLQNFVDMLQKQVVKLNEKQSTMTKEISEARKAGPGATAQITLLTNTSQKLKALQTSVASSMTKLREKKAQAASGASAEAPAPVEAKKPFVAGQKPVIAAQKPGVAAQKPGVAPKPQQPQVSPAQMKQKEEKDSKDFEGIKASISDNLDQAVMEVEAISNTAAPLFMDGQQLGTADLDNSLAEIESSAIEAQKTMAKVRTEVTNSMNKAKQYAPQARKAANDALNEFQNTLNNLGKKLASYRNFKKDFKGRQKAREALKEVVSKFETVELEIEKASNMSKATELGQMSEEEVVAVLEITKPASNSLTAAITLLAQKGKGSEPGMQAEVESLRATGQSLRQQLQGIENKMKGQREGVSAQKGLDEVKEKRTAADKAMNECQEAEMPFLKGIEVLPKDESDGAIQACEKSAQAAQAAISSAKALLKVKMSEASRYVKDLRELITDQLKMESTKIDALEQKLTLFRKETVDRKTTAVLAEVYEALAVAEQKTEDVAKATGLFASADEMASASISELEKALETAKAGEKEASTAHTEVSTMVAQKSKQLRGGDVQASLAKLNTRVKTSSDALKKQKALIGSGAKLISSKALLESCTTSLKELDALVESMEANVTLAETGELNEEGAKKLDEQIKGASKSCRDLLAKLAPAISSAPPAIKESLGAAKEKVNKAQTKIEKGRTQSKVHLEKVLAKSFQKQGVALVEALEAAVEATSEAELPFLKGLEVIPVKEALDAVEASEKSMVTANKALTETREFIAQKGIEVRSFTADVAKETKEAFTAVTERINGASQKLVAFRKDTEIRRKAAQLQQAESQVAEIETEADAAVAAAAPFTAEGADKMTEEEAAEPLEKFLKLDTAVSTKLAETRKFVSDRQKGADNAGQQQTIKTLLQKLQETQAKLAKAKKATAAHSQRYAAKRAVVDITAKIDTLKGEVEKASKACEPLLEAKGEDYLVGCSLRILGAALRAHMQEKTVTDEELFNKVAGGSPISQAALAAYLKGLPEAIGHEEVAFPASRQANLFKALDADKDGAVSLAEFQAIFKDRVVCLKDVSITDGFDLASSKTVAKVAAREELELFGTQKKHENGTVRGQCKVADGTTGWITLTGNQGSVFVQSRAARALTEFMAPMELAASAAMAKCNEAMTFMASKLKEANIAHTADGKAEAQKLRPLITAALADCEALKKRLATGKKELVQTEQREKNAHVEARERKEAAEFLDKVEPLLAVAEAAGKAVEEAGKSFVELDLEAVEAFATPATLLSQVEELATACGKKVTEARTLAKEQLLKVQEVKPPTGATKLALRELGRMQAAVEAASRLSMKTVEGVKGQCKKITEKLSKDISKALLKAVQAGGAGCEALFEELAAGSGRISEAAFCAKVQGLADLGVKPEHAKLVCRGIEVEGISRRSFLNFVQHFVVVMKDVAITNVRDMAAAKSLRKVEKDEILEVLEGPVKDDEKGLERMRCRSLVDKLEGWVTVQGNQGTSFLRDVPKPMYSVRRLVALEKEAKCASGIVREVKEDELLELLEGPKTEEVPDVKRARVKASKDNAVGFITISDRTGIVFAEPKKLYTCTASVAMTDSQNIKDCKVVRKLLVGELFEATSDPQQDEETKIWRMQGTALKDGKSGWITQKGNAGTTYVEQSKKHYTVVRATTLRKRLGETPADSVRELEAGEAVEVLETPKVEKSQPEPRIKVRALSDGQTGWVSRKEPSVTAWKPFYRCVGPASMRNQKAAEGAQVLREFVKGDRIEYLEGPFEDGKATVMKGRAEKGGVVGFVNLKTEEGKRLLDL